MKKKLALFLVLVSLVLVLSGCDSSNSSSTITSIVGRVGNVNAENGLFTVKAYSTSNLNKEVASARADKDGYFQIRSISAGSYVLKIDYKLSNFTIEYSNIYTSEDKPLSAVNVQRGNISNVGIIFTTRESLYVYKTVNAVNSINNIIN